MNRLQGVPARVITTKNKSKTPVLYTETGRTILVVESSRPVRSMLSYMLMMKYASVQEASSGAEALSAVSGGLKPNLIVIGEDEGGRPGLGFIRKLRELPGGKFVPVLAITEQDEPQSQMEWKEAGATAWITRPFTSEQLLEMVEVMMF